MDPTDFAAFPPGTPLANGLVNASARETEEMHRLRSVALATRVALLALTLPAIGCGYSSPTAPSTGGTTAGPVGATVTISSTGVSPATVTVAAGQSVTFVNNDSVAHQIASQPIPTYTDCPAINQVNRLEPGQRTDTGAFTNVRSCGFLDLLRTDDTRFQGTVVVR
jgi:plastocyanin